TCSVSGAPLPARDLAGELAATERDLTLLEPVWPEAAAPPGPAAARARAGALAGELAATERDLTLREPVWPEAAARLRPSVARALEGTGDHPRPSEGAGWPLAPVLAHGDFTAAQVLL